MEEPAGVVVGLVRVGEDKVEATQEESLVCLPGVQLLRTTQIRQVLVIRPDPKRFSRALSPIEIPVERLMIAYV